MYPKYYSYHNGIRAESFNSKMKVAGQGEVNAVPDVAEIIIGVTTEGKQLEAVQKENARITQQVIDSIKKMGVDSKDIQTRNYSINPRYDYIEGKQVFRGYTVSNNVKVTIRQVGKVGEIIDAAVKAGANTVNSINFIVSDTSKYYNEALRLAVKDAQNKATVIAEKLKVNLNITPVQIVEQGVSPIAPMPASYKTLQASTPIEPGENKITASIEAVFVYSE